MFIASAAAFFCLAVLFSLAYPRTKYAFDYAEAKFNRIVPGMSERQVRQLVGRPLETRERGGRVCTIGYWPSADDPGLAWLYPSREETWSYTVDMKGGPLDQGYRVRTVCLSNDVVVRVEKALVWQSWVWKGW
jgi:hypothetical protein